MRLLEKFEAMEPWVPAFAGMTMAIPSRFLLTLDAALLGAQMV
jgi:hypothetical protein